MSQANRTDKVQTFDISTKAHYLTKVFQSPFYTRQEPLNHLKEWGRWADYLSPHAYTDSAMEYFACRNACAVFDLTPMSNYRISGKDALPYLNRLVTRDAGKIKPGRVGYCIMCGDDGQAIDDGTIFHLGEDDYRLCTQERHLDWLLTNTLGFDVQVADETHEVAALALQGPTSCAVLKPKLLRSPLVSVQRPPSLADILIRTPIRGLISKALLRSSSNGSSDGDSITKKQR